MSERKRIAIYGGTFDPVHHGHMGVARAVVELFDLTELLFVPARQAPHKLEREVTSPLHRYAMLVLATQNHTRLLVSSFELEAPDRRFTIDTLRYFRSQMTGATDLFFVMGADSWAEINTWRDWRRLFEVANHIVVTRPGYEVRMDHIDAQIAGRIVDLRGLTGKSISHLLEAATEARIYLTDMAALDFSATSIREAARADNETEVKTSVAEPVAEYIKKYRLYKN